MKGRKILNQDESNNNIINIDKNMGGGTNLQERNSNFELLRIICMFGIISMHTFGVFHDTAVGGNLVFGVFNSSLFNIGVSSFMLISGYFGVKTSVKKIIHLECMILFYSVLTEIINQAITGGFNIKGIIVSFLPVFGCKYWYMSAYVLILVFANYINRIPKIMSRRQFEKLLLLMIIVFNVIPTIIQKDIMGNKGKNVLNLLVVYLIGRYIYIYIDKDKRKIPYLRIGAIAFLTELTLNLCLTYLSGGVGIVASFARDYSIFILVLSICIFMTFKKIQIKARVINVLSKHIVAAYLFEGALRMLIGSYILQWNEYIYKPILPLIIVGCALIILFVCLIIDALRSVIMAPIEKKITNIGINSYAWIKRLSEKIS